MYILSQKIKSTLMIHVLSPLLYQFIFSCFLIKEFCFLPNIYSADHLLAISSNYIPFYIVLLMTTEHFLSFILSVVNNFNLIFKIHMALLQNF